MALGEYRFGSAKGRRSIFRYGYIANVINSFDPEAIVLAGEIAQFDNFNLMLEPTREGVCEYTFGGKMRETKILVTELGDDSAATGAASLVLERLFNPLSL